MLSAWLRVSTQQMSVSLPFYPLKTLPKKITMRGYNV